MQTIPLDYNRAKYGRDAGVMMKTGKRKINSFTTEEAARIYEERTQVEVRNQIEKALVDMHQLDSSAAPNKVRTASARLLEAIVIAFFRRTAAQDVMSQFL